MDAIYCHGDVPQQRRNKALSPFLQALEDIISFLFLSSAFNHVNASEVNHDLATWRKIVKGPEPFPWYSGSFPFTKDMLKGLDQNCPQVLM